MLPVTRASLRNSEGFTLVSLIISIAISGLFVLAAISVSMYQQNLLRSTKLRVERVTMENLIVKSLSSEALCSCQITNSIYGTAPFTIDTTANPIAPISLGQWRSSCDGIATDNVIAATGKALSGPVPMPVVADVRLDNIERAVTNTRFTGNLTVRFQKAGTDIQLPPASVPITFSVNPSNVTAAPITGCMNDRSSNAKSRTCPAGFIMVGNPGEASTFCMETSLHGSKTQDQANIACAKLKFPTYSSGAICSNQQLNNACYTGAPAPGLNVWQQVYGFGSTGTVVVALGAGCTSIGVLGGTAPFRCCIR